MRLECWMTGRESSEGHLVRECPAVDVTQVPPWGHRLLPCHTNHRRRYASARKGTLRLRALTASAIVEFGTWGASLNGEVESWDGCLVLREEKAMLGSESGQCSCRRER